MLSNRESKFIVSMMIIAIAILIAMLKLFPLNSLITVLNGVFIGSICGIVFAFWRLLKSTVIGAPPFDRARQYALSVFIMWIAIFLTALISIISRASGNDPVPYALVAASRYFVIIAAILQITAPDFGSSFFAGKDRKFLWTAVIIGLVVSSVLIFAQEQSVLEGL